MSESVTRVVQFANSYVVKNINYIKCSLANIQLQSTTQPCVHCVEKDVSSYEISENHV